VKVKLLEFESLQVKPLQYLAKTATYPKQDINHICLMRVVVLKRPGFQSRKYGMPRPVNDFLRIYIFCMQDNVWDSPVELIKRSNHAYVPAAILVTFS